MPARPGQQNREPGNHVMKPPGNLQQEIRTLLDLWLCEIGPLRITVKITDHKGLLPDSKATS